MSRSLSNLFRRRDRGRQAEAPAPAAGVGIVFDDERREVVVTYRDYALGGQEMCTVRLPQAPTREMPHLGAVLEELRTGAPARVLPEGFSARTRVEALGDAVKTAPDSYVTSLLIENLARAADSGAARAAGPAKVIDWTRLPDGGVAVTEANQVAVTQSVERAYDWLTASAPVPSGDEEEGDAGGQWQVGFAAETWMRAVLRYYLAVHAPAVNAQAEAARPGGDKVTAVLIVLPGGCSIGTWSPARGLRELEEHFVPLDLEDFGGQGEADLGDTLQQAREANATHAVRRLTQMLTPRALESEGISGVERVVWVASECMAPSVALAVGTFAGRVDYPVELLKVWAEEAAAHGLALGGGSSAVPSIDLATDLRERNNADRSRVEEAVVARSASLRAAALLAAFAPLVLAFVVIAALAANNFVTSIRLGSAEARAQQEAARLKPIAEERRAAEENVRFFQTVFNQIFDRRSRQGGTVRLLDDLNARYPVEDPSWFVKEMSAKDDGTVEIKGLARSRQSVIAFARQLEFSGDLFRKGTVGTKFEGGVPAAQPAAAAQSGAPAESVIEWTVSGVYIPLTNDNAPAPAAQQAGAPSQAAAPKPAAEQKVKPPFDPGRLPRN